MSNFLNNMLGSTGIGNAAQGLLGGAQQASPVEQAMYNQLANQYTTALGQSMVSAKNAAAQQVFTGQGAQAIPFNPNEIEAYKVSLSNLVTLWQAKFGDEWVNSFGGEDFWHDAMFRLKDAGKLEVAKGTWCRIREDA